MRFLIGLAGYKECASRNQEVDYFLDFFRPPSPFISPCLLLHYRFLFARLVSVIDKKGLIDARNAIVRFAVIFNIAFMN